MNGWGNPARWLAAGLSLVLSIAAGASGWQRGGNGLESLLWACLSVLAVLAAHLLPAMLRHRTGLAILAAPVWLGVFLVVVFGHAQFFTLSEIHAGRERAGELATGSVSEDVPVMAPGRTAAMVAADLARAASLLPRLPEARQAAQREAIAALRLELDTVQQQEARYRADLARQQAAAEAVQADPVGWRVGQMLGVPVGSIMLMVAVFTALMLELAAVILWRLAMVATPASLSITRPEAMEPAGQAAALRADPPDPDTEQPRQAGIPQPVPVLEGRVQGLLDWLREKSRQTGAAIPYRLLLSGAPRPVRKRESLLAALADLERAGLARVVRHGRGQAVELAS